MRPTLHRITLASATVLFVISLFTFSVSSARAEQPSLETLARRHFPHRHWTACEKNLLEHASTPDFAYCGPTHSEKDPPPSDTGTKSTPYDVDADLLRWLCIDKNAVKLVDPKGIQLHGVASLGHWTFLM